jgi:predicted RNA-binding Zn ribbon-like protein
VADTEAPSLYPGEPAPVRLMNTIWADRGVLHDSLATTELARSWARSAEIRGGSRLTADQLARLRRLRDGLRRVAAHVTDDDRERALQADLSLGDAIDAVNAPLASSRLLLAQSSDDTVRMAWRHDAEGFDDVIAELAVEGARLLGDPHTELLACHGPGCVLYFVRNHPRRAWCSSTCGNRARVARHYRRSKGPASP